MHKNEHFQKICDMMKAFNQDVHTSVSIEALNDKKIIKLRKNLIIEEFYNELVLYYKDGNFLEVIDALGDILVVTYGVYAAFGLDVQFEVPNTNYDPEEPTSYPSVFNFYSSAVTIHNAFMTFSNILDKGDIDLEMSRAVNACLNTIISEIYMLSSKMNVDINSVFNEIHLSNMSKTCNSLDDAEKSIDQIVKKGKLATSKEQLFIQENFIESSNKTIYVVKRKSDLKALKGIDFFEPNLKPFLVGFEVLDTNEVYNIYNPPYEFEALDEQGNLVDAKFESSECIYKILDKKLMIERFAENKEYFVKEGITVDNTVYEDPKQIQLHKYFDNFICHDAAYNPNWYLVKNVKTEKTSLFYKKQESVCSIVRHNK